MTDRRLGVTKQRTRTKKGKGGPHRLASWVFGEKTLVVLSLLGCVVYCSLLHCFLLTKCDSKAREILNYDQQRVSLYCKQIKQQNKPFLQMKYWSCLCSCRLRLSTHSALWLPVSQYKITIRPLRRLRICSQSDIIAVESAVRPHILEVTSTHSWPQSAPIIDLVSKVNTTYQASGQCPVPLNGLLCL